MKILALVTMAGSAALALGHAAPAAAAHKAPAGASVERVGGHPNFSGIWSVMNTANWNIEPHLASAALELRPGPVVPVPAKAVVALGAVGSVPAGMGIVEGGTIPYTTQALAQREENKQHYLERDPEVKCDLPGVPRANYMSMPFQIVQSAKTLLISYEYDGAVRDILFNDPGPPPIDSWMGQSVGTWDGDTLVVTVTGQNDSTWFDRAGNFHSGDMKVVERWTMLNENSIRYQAEITDPATFTRPWKMSVLMYRRLAEDARLQQFKCVEFVEELMYGDLRKEPLK
ncbi:MAG TPA: hypothetical protein VHW71_17050 [Steroidobacteraceae bacterium]|jgi:hypothetical protein|nr:hypothetical protein [Steroidobacteraceae bacterium]